MRRLLRALATLSPFLFFASPATAGLEVCNTTSAVQNLAIAYKSGGSWVSSGWWRIEPETCVTAIPDDLRYRFYYIHAAAEGWSFRDDGIAFCIKDQDFIATGDGKCQDRGFETAQFARVDTGRGKPSDYVVSLDAYLDQGAGVGGKNAGPGQWGTPFSGKVILQGCDRRSLGSALSCELIGAGIVYRVVRDELKTPPALLGFLTGLPLGTSLYVEGDVSQSFGNHAELVLRSAVVREPDRLDQVLAVLQGRWQSRSDAADAFEMTGAERQNFYGNTKTSREHVAIMENCGDASSEGIFLYAWETLGRNGLCYLIENIDQDILNLRYLPRGTRLTYIRTE